jgi:hypothetical protein
MKAQPSDLQDQVDTHKAVNRVEYILGVPLTEDAEPASVAVNGPVH